MSWIRTRSAQKSLEILGTLSEQCAILGGGIFCNDILTLVRKGDWLNVINFKIDYDKSNHLDVLYARQIQGFFSKLDFLKLPGLSQEDAAAEAFVKAERDCFQTNQRLRLGVLSKRKDFEAILFIAQRKIASILGPLPNLSAFDFAFGPGGNTNVKSTLAMARAKLGVPLACSSNLTPAVAAFLSEVPAWISIHADSEDEESWIANIEVHRGKVSFVPKNAKTHRTIVVEPILNSFFQKGVGSFIRDRLLHRSGIDLRDQRTNQRLAQEGSINGSLATVDLSSASDCISRALVSTLLPLDWYQFLDVLRTAQVDVPYSIAARLSDVGLEKNLLDGQSRTNKAQFAYHLEKFSSMGNGFTFELESLIFFSLAWATMQHLGCDTQGCLSVYGDDIIIPCTVYPLFSEVLAHCGFTVNPEKSFCTGYFRESCGADYLHGMEIRPFYQKTKISDRSLYVMHNWFLRNAEPELTFAVSTVPLLAPVLWGPDGYGDGHLVGSFRLRESRSIRRAGWGGGYFDTYTLRALRYSNALPGDAVLPSYSVYTRSGKEDPTDPDIVRGSRGYAKVSIYTLSTSIFRRG